MNRIPTAVCCLLGLAVASVAADASPTDKKLALTCSVPAGSPDVISGGATVTLCDSSSVNGQSKLASDCPINAPVLQFIAIAVERTLLYQSPFPVLHRSGSER